MAAYNKFESFVEALALKKHNLGTDQLKVALADSANPPVASMNVLADLTQISYLNLVSQLLTTTSAIHAAGVLKLVVADLTLEASGGSVGPFQYVIVYNDTALNDELICWFDIGSEVTLADTEQLLLDFNQTEGLLQLT